MPKALITGFTSPDQALHSEIYQKHSEMQSDLENQIKLCNLLAPTFDQYKLDQKDTKTNCQSVMKSSSRSNKFG